VSENGTARGAGEDPLRVACKSSDLASPLATAYVSGLWLLLVLLAILVTSGATGCASTWKGSVGAVLGKDNRTGRVFVRDAPPGMPADRAGIHPDDEITAIDGAPVQKMSAQDLHDKLSGDVGSKVTLTVRKPGAEARDVVVERGPLRGETAP
jgi:predicted metalloprotease with PDZ domain